MLSSNVDRVHDAPFGLVMDHLNTRCSATLESRGYLTIVYVQTIVSDLQFSCRDQSD